MNSRLVVLTVALGMLAACAGGADATPRTDTARSTQAGDGAAKGVVVDARIGGFGGPWYEIQADEGGTLHWTGNVGRGDPEQVVVHPGAEAWQRFWAAVDAAGAWVWHGRYIDPTIVDGTGWEVRLQHDGRTVAATGSKRSPTGWEQVQTALEQLAGNPWR